MTWMNCNIITLEHQKTNWEMTTGINRYDNDYDALHEQSVPNNNVPAPNDNNDNDDGGHDNGNDKEDDEMTSVETTESNRATARVL